MKHIENMIGKSFLVYIPTSSDNHSDSFRRIIIVDKCKVARYTEEDEEFYEDIYVSYDKTSYEVMSVFAQDLILYLPKDMEEEYIESYIESLVEDFENNVEIKQIDPSIPIAKNIEQLVEKFMTEDGLSKEKALSKAHKTLFGNDVD